MEKAPFIIRALEAGPELEHALEVFAREQGRVDTGASVRSVRELLAGAVVFVASLEGAPVLHYALAVREHDQGREGVVLAAVGAAPGRNLTAELMPVIERQFLNCDALTVYTVRSGLERKLARQGYGRAGVILRKRLNGAGHA